MTEQSEWVTGRVRALRRQANMTMTEFAHALGYKTASGVQRYEDPALYKDRFIRRDLADKMVAGLVGKGKPAITTDDVLALAGIGSLESSNNASVGEPISRTGPLIPLYGQAAGGIDGDFILNGNEIDRVAAPPSLAGVPGAYAVHISGDSMEPRYFDGEIAYINPQTRCRKGNFVVAQIKKSDGEAPFAFVKRFVRFTEEGLVLEQYNPPKEIVFPKDSVHSVHFIQSAGAPK